LAQLARAVNVEPARQLAFARISDARPRSRGAKAPELFRKSLAPEGVGNAGRTMHPQPRVQNRSEHTSIVTTGPPKTPGIPTRNGFNGLLRDLPGDRAFLSPSSAD
jgi:hypothetical protein